MPKPLNFDETVDELLDKWRLGHDESVKRCRRAHAAGLTLLRQFPQRPETNKYRPSFKAVLAFVKAITPEHVSIAARFEAVNGVFNQWNMLIDSEKRMERAFRKRMRKVEDNIFGSAIKVIHEATGRLGGFKATKMSAMAQANHLATTKYNLTSLPDRTAEKIDDALADALAKKLLTLP
jgi:hypothetical protein